MAASPLSRLRASLNRADAQIQTAIARRLEIARRIGHTKRAQGLPVRDYAVERHVVGRWRAAMEGMGVPPERGEALARWLVEEAVRVQEQVGEAPEHRRKSADILVIGGAGSMGRWMVEFFRAGGHRVAVWDPRAPRGIPAEFRSVSDFGEAARTADVIVVATPMRVAPTVYRDLWETRTRATIFDILSIKAPLLRAIRHGRTAGFHVTSVHPLFGPATRTLSGRNLLILDCGDSRANRVAEDLFRASSLSVHRLPIEGHDLLMADVLALPHATSLLFSLALVRAGHKTGDLARAAPTSFTRQADVARVVTGENPQLSYDIQALNPMSEALFERMAEALETVRHVVRSEDQEGYNRLVGESHALLEREYPSLGMELLVATPRPRSDGRT
ncbi:MAG TPA: prephenate dehydrogenase/arogenate dehydrogenase family protein [Thermoplasmata archaeon]|nr:prephenate dehydrogenase/arogenate dehydrogenase family protein [Thermoplasmata archaeon]